MQIYSALRATQSFLSGARTCQDEPPPYFLAFRSSVLFINATICLAIFTDILLYGLIVPVIPFSLTVQVGVAVDQVQTWTAVLLACYDAALFVGSPIVGWYADRTSSRRLPLLLGLLALAGATLLLCLGKSVALLIVGRLLQGLSAAIVWSVGLALLADTMGKEVGKAVGYVSIAMSTGLLIAPTVGGAVYEAAGYYAVYYVAFAVIFLDIVLRLLLIEKKVARKWTEAPTSTPANPGTEGPLSQPGSSDGVFGKEDQEEEARGKGAGPGTEPNTKRRNPTLVLISSKRILAALFGCVVEAGAMFAFDTILPLHVKDAFDWDSTAAGLVFITVMVPGFFAPVVGALSDRYGVKWLSLFGFVASIPLFACLRFVTENTLAQKVLLCVLLVLLGFTLTLSNTPLMAEITYAIDDKEKRHPGIWGEKGVYGIAYGLFTTAFALGGTVGSLMSGLIVADYGWVPVTWSLAIWYVAAIPVVAIWVGGRLGRAKKPSAAEVQNLDVEAAPGPTAKDQLQTCPA